MHMHEMSTWQRRWRPVAAPVDRFHWLLGTRVALAFAGPVAVAHIAGRWQRDAPIVALAALVVALVGTALPAGPTRRRYAPALVAALPAAAVLAAGVPAPSVAGSAGPAAARPPRRRPRPAACAGGRCRRQRVRPVADRDAATAGRRPNGRAAPRRWCHR